MSKIELYSYRYIKIKFYRQTGFDIIKIILTYLTNLGEFLIDRWSNYDPHNTCVCIKMVR